MQPKTTSEFMCQLLLLFPDYLLKLIVSKYVLKYLQKLLEVIYIYNIGVLTVNIEFMCEAQKRGKDEL